MKNLYLHSEWSQGVNSGNLVELNKEELKNISGGFFGAFLAGLAAGYLIVTAAIHLGHLIFD
jgi:bacteriocin-like protein